MKVFIILTCLVSFIHAKLSSSIEIIEPTDSTFQGHDHKTVSTPMNFHFEAMDFAMIHEFDQGIWVQSMEGPGSRSQIYNGLSIAGVPNVKPQLFGLGNIQNFPLKLTGHWSKDSLYFESARINLHSQNGTYYSQPFTPETLPVAYIQWERGPYAGNAFQLEFQRLMTDDVHLGLNLQSRGTDSLGIWAYQNTTHQPYLNTLKRDSTEIPFTGRNLAQEQLLLTPWVQVNLGAGYIRTWANFFHIQNQESERKLIYPSPLNPTLENIYEADISEVLTKSRTTHIEGSSPLMNFAGEMRHLKIGLSQTTRRNEYAELTPYYLANRIGTQYDQLLPGKYKQRESLYHFYIRSTQAKNQHTGLLPQIQVESETRQVADFQNDPNALNQFSSLDEDVQLAQFFWNFHSQEFGKSLLALGAHRLGNVDRTQSFHPAWSLSHKFSFQAHGQWDININTSRQTKRPSLESRYIFNRTRYWIPNSNLQPEDIYQATADASWKHQTNFGYVRLFGGSQLEYIENAISANSNLNGFYSSKQDARDLLFDRQFQEAKAHNTHQGAEVGLGNWAFKFARHQLVYNHLIHNDSIYSARDIPSLLWKSQILWRSALLKKQNLGVSIRWDGTWVGQREAWNLVHPDTDEPEPTIGAPTNTSYEAQRTILDHYLQLDFEARMRISTFELYYKINNFNHDIYHTEVGYTPAGLNFRWGIVWSFEG